jgi:hypothetical protein
MRRKQPTEFLRGPVWPSSRLLALLLVCLMVTACSREPSQTPAESTAAPASSIETSSPSIEAGSPAPSAAMTPLEGRWVAGPVPVQDVKLNMRAFYDISAKEADAWIKEIGSPLTLSLSLEFAGNLFTERWQRPGQPLEIGEQGTFVRTTVAGNDNHVILTVDGDTYTLHFVVDHDQLSLTWIDSTEQGTAADKAKHRLYTIGFYCSAAFTRVT